MAVLHSGIHFSKTVLKKSISANSLFVSLRYVKLSCRGQPIQSFDNFSDTYNLIMCIGSLLPTHINEKAFDEIIRITKPGNTITTIRL